MRKISCTSATLGPTDAVQMRKLAESNSLHRSTTKRGMIGGLCGNRQFFTVVWTQNPSSDPEIASLGTSTGEEARPWSLGMTNKPTPPTVKEGAGEMKKGQMCARKPRFSQKKKTTARRGLNSLGGSNLILLHTFDFYQERFY